MIDRHSICQIITLPGIFLNNVTNFLNKMKTKPKILRNGRKVCITHLI